MPKRSDVFAVLIALLILGAGAYLSTYPADVIRGVGIALMAVSILGLIVWFLWERRPKAMPTLLLLGGITFTGLAVLSFGAWFFWPRPSLPFSLEWIDHHAIEFNAPPLDSLNFSSNPKPNVPPRGTYENLYLRAFSSRNMFAFEERPTIVLKYAPPNDKQTVKIIMRIRVYQDFDTNSEFVGIFLPTIFPDFDGATIGVLELIKEKLPELYGKYTTNFVSSLKDQGGNPRSAKDMQFTGRVYIYTENIIEPVPLGKEIEAYRQAGMHLDVRGPDYWALHRND